MEQRNAQLDLDHDLTAPRAARGFVSTVLLGWGVPARTVELSELLVSELVSNAVLHGDGPIRMLVREEDPVKCVIRVEVSNRSEGRPVVRRAQHDELSGRGLQLIEDLARGWGTRSNNGHTFVWFEVDPTDD